MNGTSNFRIKHMTHFPFINKLWLKIEETDTYVCETMFKWMIHYVKSIYLSQSVKIYRCSYFRLSILSTLKTVVEVCLHDSEEKMISICRLTM